MEGIPIPQCITDKLLELNKLAEKYPENIPIAAAAKFLDLDARSIKSYLMGPCSFGMGWCKAGAANRAFHIPTAKFYTWYRNMTAYKNEVIV